MSDSDFRMDVHCTDACMNPLALADTHWASLTTPVEDDELLSYANRVSSTNQNMLQYSEFFHEITKEEYVQDALNEVMNENLEVLKSACSLK